MQRRNKCDYNYVFAVCMFNYNMSIFIDSLLHTNNYNTNTYVVSIFIICGIRKLFGKSISKSIN